MGVGALEENRGSDALPLTGGSMEGLCLGPCVFDMLDGWRNVDVCGGELPRQTEP